MHTSWLGMSLCKAYNPQGLFHVILSKTQGVIETPSLISDYTIFFQT